MARGFSSLGTGATDIITSAYTTENATTSYFISYLRHGDGGANVGRLFHKSNGHLMLWNANSSTRICYLRGSVASSDGLWNWPDGADADVWHNVAISMDTGDTANNPVVYVDGVLQTVTEVNAPTSFESTANAYSLGNRASDSARVWDGSLANFALWNVLLTAGEMVALTKGFDPALVRPASLVEYIPMVRANVSLKLAAPTIGGTPGVQPHPRVITRSRAA